jgi:hypothetical protein
MNCKICSGKTEVYFTPEVLNKYNADFFYCRQCNFLFAGDPFWLPEAYSRAINISDTGILQRNIYFSKVTSVIINYFYNKEGKFLDYAGGYGIFTRLMRDIGFDFYWSDPYCENLLAGGFEYKDSPKGEIELITAFEVFEHLVDPLPEFQKMSELTDTIIFSTQLIPSSGPPAKDWWYYGFEHGQHVSFYSEASLENIAEKTGFHYYKFRDLKIFSKKELDKKINYLSNIPVNILFFFVNNISKTNSDFEKLKKIK